MSKIILLNGPKACGKNVAVDRIKWLMEQEGKVVVDRRCKDHLFTLTSTLFKMSMDEFNLHYECRASKESPKTVFSISGYEYNRLAPIIEQIGINPLQRDLDKPVKLSVREALIYVSEVVCKPAFGRDYFGTARANSIDPHAMVYAIDDSCGFDDEIDPTLERLGQNQVLLIRIRGRGSFNGDSRNFISNGVVENTIDVHNEGTEEEFLDEISKIALEFYNK